MTRWSMDQVAGAFRGPRAAAGAERAQQWLRGDLGPEGYTYGSAKLVTGLMVLGGLLYLPTAGWGLLICLVAALIALVGRRMIENQVRGDFSDLEEARRQYRVSHDERYLEFIQARSQQMLQDNMILRPGPKAKLQGNLEDVERWRKRRR